MDTYLLSNLERTTITGTYHEWMTDALASAAANRYIEGDDFSATAFTSPSRVGNYTQISKKQFTVSRTQDAVKKAGRKTESARQSMKQMRELKRDIELALVGNQASSAGGSTTARSSAGMESWIASTDNGGNGVRATTTASASTAGFTSGACAAPTDGTTTAALTEAKFKEALQLAWADGGDPRLVIVNTTQKGVIGGFSGVATKYNEIKGNNAATIIGAVDMYVSDVGNHTILLHRYVRQSVVLAIDPDYWSVGFLEAPFMEKLAKTGDGDKYHMVTEFTLISRNANASAKVAACA